MRLMVRGGKINHRELISLLNKVLNKYNIRVDGVLESEKNNEQVIGLRLRLIKPVYYSPHLSQLYDRVKDEYFETSGYYVSNPDAKYGRKQPYLHFYHYALANDTIVYIMEELKRKGVIREWELKTSVLTVKDENWRRIFPFEYLPQLDPAFRRPVDTYVSFKRVRVPTRRDKALLFLERLNTYLEKGRLRPRDLLELEDVLMKATETQKYYEEVGDKDSIWAEKPSLQAWMLMKHGSGEKADIVWKWMTEEEREAERKKLVEFLENADPNSNEFKNYLWYYKDRIRAILYKYMELEGVSPREILREKDDAGFPLDLAKHLVHKPYVPPEVKSLNLEVLARKERRAEKLEW